MKVGSVLKLSNYLELYSLFVIGSTAFLVEIFGGYFVFTFILDLVCNLVGYIWCVVIFGVWLYLVCGYIWCVVIFQVTNIMADLEVKMRQEILQHLKLREGQELPDVMDISLDDAFSTDLESRY